MKGHTASELPAHILRLPLKCESQDFPGDPVVKTFLSSARGLCLIPGWGAIVKEKKKKEKDPNARKDQRQKEKWVSEDEMVR